MLPTKTNSFDIVAVKSMTIQDLKAELAKTLSITAEYLMYIAAIRVAWRGLERVTPWRDDLYPVNRNKST